MKLVCVEATAELVALPGAETMTLCRVWHGVTPTGETVRLLVVQNSVRRDGNWQAIKAQLDALDRDAVSRAELGDLHVQHESSEIVHMRSRGDA